MRALSIKTRLFIYSMLFCFAGLATLGVYSYYTARNALQTRTFSQLTLIREEKAKQLDLFFRDRTRELNFATTNSDLKKVVLNLKLNNSINHNELKNNEQLNDMLLFLKSADCYRSIGIGVESGHIFFIRLDEGKPLDHTIFSTIESHIELKGLAEHIEKSGKVEFSDFTPQSITGGRSIYIAMPIINSREKLGTVFLEIPDMAMNRLMAERIDMNGMGRTGEVYLVGTDYLMRSSSRFVDNSVLNISTKNQAVEDALNGEAGTAKIIDYRGQPVLSSYCPVNLPNLKWAIVAEMDWNEALYDTALLKRRILIIGAIIFLLTTVGVFMFSWVVTNPLVKLKEAAIRVGQGKFDWIIPVSHRDEIGLLTQVFNKMTLRLKHTTQRLKEREQRLLHFYRATIDGILFHKSGKTILVNRALINLTGFTEDELLKREPASLFISDDYLFRFSNGADSHSFETILVTKKSEKIPVEVQHRRMSFHDQEVEVMVIRNIAERKAIEDELKVERLHRLRSVIDGQEQERQRLSRELHDGLGQTLVAIKLRLESIPLEKLGDQQKTIEVVKQMFNQTIDETRRISNNLMPAALNQFSLAVVLRNLCNEVESNSGINVSLVVGVLPDSLDMLTKTYAYRIVQEALTNIVKHSNAKRAVVSVFSDIHKLFLHIEDNGLGFNKSKVSEKGNGLYNMKERTSLLNGRFEIVTSPGKGTMVKVEFPISNQKGEKNG